MVKRKTKPKVIREKSQKNSSQSLINTSKRIDGNIGKKQNLSLGCF